MLKGQAKKDYQRNYMKEYMRDLRSKGSLLRPKTLKPVKTQELIPKPITDAPWIDDIAEFVDSASEELDNNPIYEE